MNKKFKDVGIRIAQLRKSKGLKQSECLEGLGDPTIQMLSSWENGRSFPSPTYLINIAKFFNVSLDYLVFGKRDEIFDNKTITYKELFMCLNILIKSNLFAFNMENEIKTGSQFLKLTTCNEVVLKYVSDYELLEKAYNLLGKEIFETKIRELVNNYNFDIE